MVANRLKSFKIGMVLSYSICVLVMENDNSLPALQGFGIMEKEVAFGTVEVKADKTILSVKNGFSHCGSPIAKQEIPVLTGIFIQVFIYFCA